MSGDNENNKDFDNLINVLRELSNRDGSGDRLNVNDSLENHPVPSYEDFVSNIDYHTNSEESEMLACTPNLSTINRMSWNDTPFVHALRMSTDTSNQSVSSSSASIATLEKNIDCVDEIEGVPMHWVVLIIILSILMPLLAYIIYKMLH